MASTYTPSLRLNLQGAGDNLNTWGLILNSGVFGLVDTSISGRLALSLSGSVTLTSLNGVADQARNAMIHVTGGTGGTIIVPSVTKIYQVLNGSSGVVTITAGATGASLVVGESSFVMCDGSNVTKIIPQGFPTPLNNTDAANKAYVDGVAFGSSNLPGINVGTAGLFVGNDGVTASWSSPFPTQTGNARKFLSTSGLTTAWSVAGFKGYAAKVANYTLAVTDKEYLIDCTGTFNLTFPAASTMDTDFGVWVRNNGTGDISLVRSGSDTIDGLTAYIMYPGEMRFFLISGASSYVSFVVKPFTRTFTASGTFTTPPGYVAFTGEMWSGGGSGRKNVSAADKCGGGGGCCTPFLFQAADMSATETVTIGAGGAPQTVNATNGNNGGDSIFKTVTAKGALGGTATTGNGGQSYANPNNQVTDITDAVGNVASAYLAGSTCKIATGTSTIWGAGSGGGITAADALGTLGPTVFGGVGGLGSLAGNGADGTAPGGGGGATKSGTQSGAGARGELRIRGIS